MAERFREIYSKLEESGLEIVGDPVGIFSFNKFYDNEFLENVVEDQKGKLVRGDDYDIKVMGEKTFGASFNVDDFPESLLVPIGGASLYKLKPRGGGTLTIFLHFGRYSYYSLDGVNEEDVEKISRVMKEEGSPMPWPTENLLKAFRGYTGYIQAKNP